MKQSLYLSDYNIYSKQVECFVGQIYLENESYVLIAQLHKIIKKFICLHFFCWLLKTHKNI